MFHIQQTQLACHSGYAVSNSRPIGAVEARQRCENRAGTASGAQACDTSLAGARRKNGLLEKNTAALCTINMVEITNQLKFLRLPFCKFDPDGGLHGCDESGAASAPAADQAPGRAVRCAVRGAQRALYKRRGGTGNACVHQLLAGGARLSSAGACRAPDLRALRCRNNHPARADSAAPSPPQ